MFYGIIALCGILSFLSIRSNFYPLKWVTGFSWLGLMVYWLTTPPVVKGTPTDVIFMLVFLMLGLLFLLWGFVTRGETVEIEAEIPGEDGLKKMMRYTQKRKDLKVDSDGILDYKLTIRRAARGNKRKK